MSERIDHVGEANAILQAAEVYVSVEHVQKTGEKKSDQLVNALVHAALALVEQQRLANIIALAHVADTSDAAVSPLEQTAWEAIGITGSGEMRPEIREALGLS